MQKVADQLMARMLQWEWKYGIDRNQVFELFVFYGVFGIVLLMSSLLYVGVWNTEDALHSKAAARLPV